MPLKQLCRKTGYTWMSLPSYIKAQLLFKNMEPPCLICMNRQQPLRHKKKKKLSVVFLTCSCVTVITSHPFVFLPWSYRSCTFHTSTCSIQYAYRNPITSMSGGRQWERARNVQMLQSFMRTITGPWKFHSWCSHVYVSLCQMTGHTARHNWLHHVMFKALLGLISVWVNIMI